MLLSLALLVPLQRTIHWQDLRVFTWIPFVIACISFILAGSNTYMAANSFGERERAILNWLRLRLDFLEAEAGKSGAETKTHDFNDNGSLSLWRHAEHAMKKAIYTIVANGCYQPKPFHRAGKNSSSQFHLQEYLELLNKEVREDRRTAAAIAGGLGGLFVASLQVFFNLSKQ